jgi:flagellar motor switch protein FliN
MNGEQTLLRLAAIAVDAIRDVVGDREGAEVASSEATIVPSAARALGALPLPGLVVSTTDPALGTTIFAASHSAARRLAAAASGATAPDGSGAPEPSEPEVQRFAELAAPMVRAASAVVGPIVGIEVESTEPRCRSLATAAEAEAAFGEQASRATVTELVVLGEPCVLVSLLPNAFVVRLTRALDELGADVAPDEPATSWDQGRLIGSSLLGSTLRVWAEVGRTRLPAGRVVGLPAGSVIELDRQADDPVDLYVNGLRFATGRLVVADGEWALRLDEILAGPVGDERS